MQTHSHLSVGTGGGRVSTCLRLENERNPPLWSNENHSWMEPRSFSVSRAFDIGKCAIRVSPLDVKQEIVESLFGVEDRAESR